jgi:hypothetical protein
MKPHVEAAQALEAQIKELHARIDALAKERIHAVAAKISGAPVGPLRDTFVARCSGGYCRCRAIRIMAADADGL